MLSEWLTRLRRRIGLPPEPEVPEDVRATAELLKERAGEGAPDGVCDDCHEAADPINNIPIHTKRDHRLLAHAQLCDDCTDRFLADIPLTISDTRPPDRRYDPDEFERVEPRVKAEAFDVRMPEPESRTVIESDSEP